MKSKKLISLLCAAAMSASAFAGLTVTASAADSVLYSNNFNGYPNDRALAVPYNSQNGWKAAADSGKQPFKNFLEWNTPTSYKMVQDAGELDEDALKAAEGLSIECGKKDDDDTAAVYVREKEDTANDLYVSLPKGRFGKQGNTLISGFDTLKATTGEDLLISFKMMMTLNDTDRTDKTLQLQFGDIGTYDYTNAIEGTWQDVRAIIKADGTKEVYVGEEKVLSGTSTNTLKDLTVVMPTAGDKANNGKYPSINIDDMVVMSVATGTGTTVTVPNAKTVTDDKTFNTTSTVATPVPDTAAPGLAAPEGTTAGASINFNNVAATKWTLGATAQTIEDIPGMTVAIGARNPDGDNGTYAEVAKNVSDNALTLVGGQYSTAGRGPVVSLDNNLDISSDTSKTAVMSFAVKLSTAAKNGAGRLYILKDNTQAGDKGDGAYRNAMAVLTTDGTGSTITRGGNTEDVIGVDVTADEWHTVTVMVSDQRYRVFIDGSKEAAIVQQYVASGSGATTATALPILAVTSAASNGASTYSTAKIDNIITYTGTINKNASELLPTTEAAPTPAPIPAKVTMRVDDNANTVTLTSDKDTDAVLVQASYRTDNTLDSVKKVVNVALTAGTAYTVPATDLDAFTTNDKIMVWDSLKTMTPLASAYTIKNGAAQATAKPAPTAEPTEAPAETVAPTAEPTEAPAETVDPTAEPTEAPATTAAPTVEPTEAPAETAAPTDTPAPTATPVPTYAVSGTVDAGVKSVTLTDKAEAENTITGTIEDTAVTFTGVKAGTYTVSAVAKDDYKDLTVTPQEITVSGNLAGVFTVTTTAKVKSAVTTTVTGGTATVTGATDLKSVAEGTELTITAATPALGYLAADPTITVTKTDDAETTVTVAEGKFTMPAYPVTVTVAYAADPTVAIATLENTATSGWGSNKGTTVNTETGLEHFNNDTDTSWAGTAFAQFTLPTLAEGEGVAKAELIYNVKQGGNRSRTSKIFALTNGEFDLTTLTGAAADRFADARTLITSFDTAVGENALTTDVTAAAQGKNGKITLMFTDNAGGADLYGKASADKAPVLKITKGKVVTFNVAAAANADTKVAGAKIVVKNGDTTVATITTNDEGVASTALSAGTYTYTVESNDYAIKKDGTLTVADSVVAENVALAANAATTVEIANPATGTTLAQGEEATYTATVKDQDGRVMTATVDWAVVNGEDAAAENITVANGKVNVAEEATTGDYKVKATVNGTTVSATADLKVIAAEKLNLSITSQDAEQGTVAYTVNGVASTDTQLNKGKAIVATATPAALYEFVGWVTSTENLITGTYVSTDAQYSFDLTANTTLIAVFKYTGIYYQNDYNNATESDWVSGNTDRYTVSIAGDDDKYTQISAVKTGNNGTSITSSAVQVGADKDYIAEFDLALTGGNGQPSGFAVNAKDSKKYALVLQLKTAGSTTWTVNGTTEVTLEKGVFYHYTIEKVETGVKVTIAPKAGGDAVVDGVTYANDTATTGEFAGTVSNAGLAGMQFNTKRYYAGMQIDNVLVKAPATTSVTE